MLIIVELDDLNSAIIEPVENLSWSSYLLGKLCSIEPATIVVL